METGVLSHLAQGLSGSAFSAPSSRIHHQVQEASSSFGAGVRSGGRSGVLHRRGSLAPLEVTRNDEAFLHIRHVFKPSPQNGYREFTLETIVSSPLPAASPLSEATPLHALNDRYHKEIVKQLGELFHLPSPDRTDVDINRHPFAHLKVGERWQEMQGAGNWEGLMDETMDPVLRGELIRYGEFAQATYDAFDNDEDSKLCGNSKFGKEELLDQVGLENRGYTVTQYLYATADAHLPKFFANKNPKEDTWSKDSNFMGFVAVCTSPRELKRLGRRDIVVAWRGTVTKLEWLENVRDFFSPTGLDPRGKSEVMVESGFLDVYKASNKNSRYNKLSAREQVLSALKELVKKYKHEDLSITVTGHSLGSALSMICAYDIAESGINKRAHSPRVPHHWDEPHLDAVHKHPDHDKEPLEERIPVSVFSYAGPRLGNSAFKARVEELGVKVLRVVNTHDFVPRVPGVIFNEKLEFLHNFASWLPTSFVHVGTELKVDSNVSEYLRDTTDPINAHNLEAYLHLLDGYHGQGAPFSPAVKRDIALVNKASNFLEPRFGIPTNWWEDQKMVKDKESGRWIVRESTVLETSTQRPY